MTTTSNELRINIPCDHNYAKRKALKIKIETASWHAHFADKQGRHVDAETYRREKESLQRQLDELE